MPNSLSSVHELRGRSYISDVDFTRDELQSLIELAIALKSLPSRRSQSAFLKGHLRAMVFETASNRTRVSLENGMAELGENAVYLRPGEIHLPGCENILDTARTLSQMNSAIAIRSHMTRRSTSSQAGQRSP
jgi:ornithine carbamoyltransferase